MDTQIFLDKLLASELNAEKLADTIPLLEDLKKDSIIERAYSRYVRDVCLDMISSLQKDENLLSSEETLSIVKTYRTLLKMDAASDFDAYMLYMEIDREPEKRFWLPRRHVLLPIAFDLQDLADSRLDFLAVSLPPRVGKSTMCIFFLTFIMGRNPDKANVMSGHSDKLTKGFHQEALSIITDDKTYKFAEIFPHAPFVANDMKNESISLGEKRRFPTLTCRSVDGTLTGAVEVGRGALLYCDDLVSDREEALNKSRMDKLYQTYLNQLKDRMLDGAKQLFVGTRWVPDDPIGRIEEEYKNDKRYRFTVLPALNENNESNFVYHHNLGFSTQYYLDMKRSLENAGETDSWSAKYMCAPFWKEGLLFELDELNFYDGTLPDGEPDAILCACDTKDRGTDYFVQPIGYIYGDRHYIHDVICDNSLPEVVLPRLVSSIIRNNVSSARYESNAAGGTMSRQVADECKLQGHYVEMRTKYSTTNKETRILNDAGWIKQKCYFRSDNPSKDYTQFMKFLTSYTITGKNKHDDVPDAMSMYKRFCEAWIVPKAEPAKRIL